MSGRKHAAVFALIQAVLQGLPQTASGRRDGGPVAVISRRTSAPMHLLRSILCLGIACWACVDAVRAQTDGAPAPTQSASIVRGSCPGIPATPAAIQEGSRFVATYRVLADGSLASLDLETSTGIEAFDKALLDALRHCTYSPAKAGGQAVDGHGRLVLPFRSNASSQRARERVSVPGLQSCAPTAADYPRESERQREEGTTRVRFTVGADGKLKDAVVAVSSGHFRLDRAAVAKLSQCEFRAGRAPDGTPVGGVFEVDYVWKLQ